MKNTLPNNLTKIFKSFCTSNVYPRLPMAFCLVLCTLGLGLSVNAAGTNTTVTKFDDPGAGTCSTSCGTIGPGQGTRAYGINPSGEIAGFYSDNTGRCHGYARAANGTFTQIDAPGEITGFYFDANFVGHGFLRALDGTITSFDAPGADTTPGTGNGTFGVSLTPNGDIEGVFVDAQGVLHGFVRTSQGIFSTFDAPG